MPNIPLRSFSSGEVTTSIYGRTDLVKYATGLKICKNFIVQRHGGVANRPGTGFVCEVKDSSKKVKLIPFVFNADQTYMLEFGHQYIRVIRNKTLLTKEAENISGITKANPCVVTVIGQQEIRFNIRASRTGSNIKIGIRDSGGTTTEITPNITQADTWQEVIWDISGVSNANKDAIERIIITILNANADNTFYLDNFRSTTGGGINIDLMEYGSHSAAQGAYQSSDNVLTYGSDVIPQMTSYNAPSGEVSASSYVSVHYPWRAFDNTTDGADSKWQAGGAEGWLQYKFPSAKRIGKYTIQENNEPNYLGRSPKSWTFEGSNDGVSWTILDTRTNEVSWSANEKRTYTFNNDNSYIYYRINITSTNNGGLIFIGEMEMMEVSDGNLYCKSEPTIKQQGDYSLKVFAKQTDSLNDTVTRTVSPTTNLTGHSFSNGDEVYISNVGGMTELNNRNFKVANITTETFSLKYMDGTDVNSTSFGTYTSGGLAAEVYEIQTPYTENDLEDIQTIQSADIITLVHPLYAPRELKRTGHTSWTLDIMTFGTEIATPTNISVSSGGAGSKTFKYVVTAIDPETSEESLPSSVGQIINAADPTASAPHTVSWTNISGVVEYNIYREQDGLYGWIGIAGSSPFKDKGYAADPLDNPPEDRQPFIGKGNYPSTTAYYQQRLIFANTDNNPEGVWTSKTAIRKNFMISSPLQDDDAVTFTLLGRQINEIRHLLDLGKLLIFTTSGEWVAEGDSTGALVPGEANPSQHTHNGSGLLPPLVIGGNALYVQARGSLVRDLGYDFQTDSYRGNELSIFSAHLFDSYTLSDWTYQQIPHSIVWNARNDGVLLGMTYLREHQVFGWHRHTFDEKAENVESIPEGTEDVLYLTIKRTINGKNVKYIEYMKTRQILDIIDAVFMDSSLSYNGRNYDNTHSMTLSGGTNWTYNEDLTLTSNKVFFTSADVGNQIVLNGTDKTIIRCTIKSYTSGTVVTVNPHKTVPSGMRNTAIYNWSKAVDEVGGLWHLEGKNVSILSDGMVQASPNNPAYTQKTVTNGKVTLDTHGSVIHVGLPFVSDLETLNIDTSEGSSIMDRKKNIGRLSIFVESSRGIWVGPDEDNLTELKIREDEGYDKPIRLITDVVDINIEPEWKSNGRIFIRQTDPLPLTILSIVPTGYMG